MHKTLYEGAFSRRKVLQIGGKLSPSRKCVCSPKGSRGAFPQPFSSPISRSCVCFPPQYVRGGRSFFFFDLKVASKWCRCSRHLAPLLATFLKFSSPPPLCSTQIARFFSLSMEMFLSSSFSLILFTSNWRENKVRTSKNKLK